MCSTCDFEGIQIPIGQQGAVGPQGPAGADGADGSNGTNGTNGVSVLYNVYPNASTTTTNWEVLDTYQLVADQLATNEDEITIRTVFITNEAEPRSTQLVKQVFNGVDLNTTLNFGFYAKNIVKIIIETRLTRVSNTTAKYEMDVQFCAGSIGGTLVTQKYVQDLQALAALNFTTTAMTLRHMLTRMWLGILHLKVLKSFTTKKQTNKMAQFSQDKIIITNAGITQLYSQGQLPDIIYVAIDNAGATLAANVDIGSTFTPPAGFTVQVFVNASTALDLNGCDFYLFGSLISADQLKGQVYFTLTSNGVDWSAPYIGVALYDVPGAEKTLSGRFLVDSSVALTALEPPLAAQLLLGNALGQGSWATMSKDATIDDTGALTISAGAIDNSKVSASAAIALSKLAPLTASKPVVTNGSGVLTTASQITAAQGGTGQDTSSSTGFAKVSGGTWSIS